MLDLALTNLLQAPILFFTLGALASLLRSDLKLPDSGVQLLSAFLLVSIGFHGGLQFRLYGTGVQSLLALLAALVLAIITPCIVFAFLRKKLKAADAAGVAACYGSVSAVTFLTALALLDNAEIEHGAYMVAALALMEFPAILVGILLYRQTEHKSGALGPLIHEGLTSSPVVLLVGSLIIGFATGHLESSVSLDQLFKENLFRPVLCFFLLEMGLKAMEGLRRATSIPKTALAFGLAWPPIGAALGLLAAWILGLNAGNGFLLMTLSASASYIAAPAALRASVPRANPGLYLPLSLGITFPFNLIVGLPIYLTLATTVLS
jgi:hypothetical protein